MLVNCLYLEYVESSQTVAVRLVFITAEAAELCTTLAVLKVTSQASGNTEFLGSHYPKTISAIKMKFGTVDYVAEGNPQPTFCNDRLLRTSPHIGET